MGIWGRAVAAIAGVVILSGCANGSFGESAASGMVQGVMSAIGLDVVTASAGGDVVQGANRAMYRTRKDAEAAKMPSLDNGVVPTMSATQAALNNAGGLGGHVQVDPADWKAPLQNGVVPVAASDTAAEIAVVRDATSQ